MPNTVQKYQPEVGSGSEGSLDSPSEMDEVDVELYAQFLTLRTGSGKVHKPAAGHAGQPRCGVAEPLRALRQMLWKNRACAAT